MERFRWGIISTGKIAGKFAQALNHLPDAELVAVGSRSQDSADAFGEQHGIPRRYDSYEALVQDPAVQVVYIGTPHVYHLENTLLALNAGKHVLCEKPFAINAQQAQRGIDRAREKGLFLMEAVWMRYIPAIVQLRDWLAEGRIGEVRVVQADFNVPLPSDPQGRMYNRALGGGALLDLGLYPISFATMILGMPQVVKSHVHMTTTGVDEQEGLLLGYEGGITAMLTAGMAKWTRNTAVIKGENGTIQVQAPFHHPTDLTLHVQGQQPENYHIPYESNGLNYEAAEVHECLRAGKLESAAMPLEETLQTLQLMDALRAEWGLTYPGE